MLTHLLHFTAAVFWFWFLQEEAFFLAQLFFAISAPLFFSRVLFLAQIDENLGLMVQVSGFPTDPGSNFRRFDASRSVRAYYLLALCGYGQAPLPCPALPLHGVRCCCLFFALRFAEGGMGGKHHHQSTITQNICFSPFHTLHQHMSMPTQPSHQSSLTSLCLPSPFAPSFPFASWPSLSPPRSPPSLAAI